MTYRKSAGKDFMMHSEDSSVFVKEPGRTSIAKKHTNLRWSARCEKCNQTRFMYANQTICDNCK